MIHDATVEVTCDGRNCRESVCVDLPAGARNTYLAEDSQIERDLAAQEWIVENSQHFCCQECRDSIMKPPKHRKRHNQPAMDGH